MIAASLMAVALGLGDERLLALSVLAAGGVVVGDCLLRGTRQLEAAFAYDALLAAALWWFYGPIAGLDFILFYVVAASAIVLPRRSAIRVTAVALASELSQVPLHYLAGRVQLPLFHPPAQVHSDAEFLVGAALRAGFILLTAALFLAISSILRRTERERRASERQYRRLYEEAPYAYLTVAGGRITNANEAAVQLLGRGVSALADVPCVDLYAPGPDGQDRAVQALERVMSGDSIRGEELRLATSDGSERWVALTADPVFGVDGEIVEIRAALEDITERRRVEALRAEAQQQLEDLVSAKDQFIASVSHELRTPLAAVMGFAEELRQSWVRFLPEERQEILDLIAGQSRDVSYMVEDLLVAARADVEELTIVPDQVDLGQEVSAVIESVSFYHFDAARRIAEEPLGPSTMAWADPARVRQVIRNLITNALRYGGPSIRFVTAATPDQAVIEVRDDGDGIPEELRDRIFEPYGRAHAARGLPDSVGLGLAVATKLARLMAGELTYTHDGAESIFRLSLPSAPAIQSAAS